MKLYHFTSLYHLPRICESGCLSRGDIPLTQTSAYGEDGHGVWLTTQSQSGNKHGLSGSAVDKTEVRFTIEIDESNPQLFRWSEFAKLNNVSPKWYKILDRVGGGMSHTWWLYIGELDINSSQVNMAIKQGNSYIPKTPKEVLE